MKTIRHNIFESNSSSTHSVSICNIATSTEDNPVETSPGVLNPNNIKSKCYGETTIVEAKTRPDKIAYILGCIQNHNDWGDVKISEETIHKIVEQAGYKLGIPIEDIKSGYPNSGEYDDPIFNFEMLENGDLSEILSVINDDDKMILYTDSPY